MIRKCNPNSTLSNLSEIGEYVKVRQKVPRIGNIERLLGILNIYYSTLLYYLEHSPEKHLIKIHKQTYTIEIGSQTTAGITRKLSLPEIGDSLISFVFSDLKASINANILNQLLNLLNDILLTPQIPLTQKLHIFNHESEVSNNNWIDLLKNADPLIASTALTIRREIILEMLTSESLGSIGLEDSDRNIDSLNQAYVTYNSAYLKILIKTSQYAELFAHLFSELKLIESLSESALVNQQIIMFSLLNQLIATNHIFHMYRWSAVGEIVEEYSELISEESLSELETNISTDISDVELKNLSIELVDPDFALPENEVLSTLYFVVPYSLEGDAVQHEIDDSTSISYSKIQSLYDDPIFSYLDSSNLQMNGVPFVILSDSLGNINSSTLITISIKKLLHPDFNVVDGKAEYIDFHKEDAQHGGKYYPHKDFIIDVLEKAFFAACLPLGIEKDDINSNLISNYFVAYQDGKGEIIHQKVYTITNFDSYRRIKDRYLNAVSGMLVNSEDSEFQEFLLHSKIYSQKTFINFCYALIERTIKKSIEFGGLQAPLWVKSKNDSIPIKETLAQPIIFNQLRVVCEAKGIFLGREVYAADGSVDFLFFYSHQGRPLSVCVELKNAHNQNIVHGICSQLPLYMRDMGSKYGIYIILWYKGDSFDLPRKYKSITELESQLEKIKPKKRHDIQIMIIDGTPKISPSKQAANKRLERTHTKGVQIENDVDGYS